MFLEETMQRITSDLLLLHQSIPAVPIPPPFGNPEAFAHVVSHKKQQLELYFVYHISRNRKQST